jgi:tight adherence protein C
METRIGIPRSEAMKNMGLRTGNAAIQQFVAMLVQAERFGTSIADALRIQSETLRVKRQHVAEEMAAKASVKMSFPLVLFIFPATFIVLAGPTVIGLFKSELFK